MKKSIAILLGIMALSFASCDNNDEEMLMEQESTEMTIASEAYISGEVVGFDNFGMMMPSFTPQDMFDAGFEYSDLLNVKIGNQIVLNDVPFVTGFNEVGVLETCLCDYNGLGQTFGLALLHGNFQERIGGKPGEVIQISLSKKHGYNETWQIMKSVYSSDRMQYPSDEAFANFRPVTTSGMKSGVLYRSSNPLNPKDNAVRYAYVDDLARQAGIQTEIDLADTEAKIDNFLSYPDYASSYCPSLYKNGKVIALGLTSDTYSSTFMNKLGEGLRFMLQNQPPYLIHCNEGKDRCGFVIMLLESLAGATYNEVAADYMQTLINFYKIEKGGASYQLRQGLSVDRLVWLLENVSAVNDFTAINWLYNDPKSVDLQKAARKYIMQCGLTETECDQLQALLNGGNL